MPPPGLLLLRALACSALWPWIFIASSCTHAAARDRSLKRSPAPMWRLVRAVAFCRFPPGPPELLNHVGPLLLPGIVATLVALIILGFALLYWSHLPESFNSLRIEFHPQGARGDRQC